MWAHEEKTQTKGFTIVELLIVIVVIAILAAITIIGYVGIQEQARQSRNLATLDAYEKALRMSLIETNDFPQLIDPVERNQLISNFSEETEDALREILNPTSSEPIHVEVTIPFCLNGNYPATDIFRVNECQVSSVVFDFNDPSIPDLHTRTAYVQSDALPAALSPTYISTLPLLDMTTYSSVYTVGNREAEIELDGQSTTELATIQQSMASRGATYNVFSNAVAISYYTLGDQSCGRGTKYIHDYNDILQQLDEQLAELNDGVPIESQITADLSVSGGPVWTQCSQTVYK